MPTSANLVYGLLNGIGGPQRSAARSLILSATNAMTLRTALAADTTATLAKACLTLADAIGCLDRAAYSWACIKLYYSSYYSVKSWLFASDECHIYLGGRTPAYVRAIAGTGLATGKGNSHEFAFSRFETRFASQAILSQNVGPDNPFDWLRFQREEMQYTSQSFPDPDPPPFFVNWCQGNPRSLIQKYVETPAADIEFADLFDVDHAMIALPVRLLAETIGTVRKQRPFKLPQKQLSHFTRLCCIRGKPVAGLSSLVRE